MRDYIHLFVNIDSDLDGCITVDNFRKCFSSVMPYKQIQDLFQIPGKQEYRLMELVEFLEVVKPKDTELSKDVIRT